MPRCLRRGSSFFMKDFRERGNADVPEGGTDKLNGPPTDLTKKFLGDILTLLISKEVGCPPGGDRGEFPCCSRNCNRGPDCFVSGKWFTPGVRWLGSLVKTATVDVPKGCDDGKADKAETRSQETLVNSSCF
jgi:hypothetical protein